ncbi:hypothetical protein GCM10010531_21980 [Blastococcus jejuensis]|uniref:HNH nuclease domain-containing protein n=1 Tax=Blastococcus jejuensis TaxID=351224 RepID=A0ABP6P6V3_9ACTN
MFEGDGFGVGLTVQQLDVPGVPGPGAWVPPGDRDWHPTRLSELMPVATRSEAGLALEMRRTNVLDSRLWAHRVDLAVQLAVHRRADRDRPAGRPGAAVPGWAQSSWVLEGYSEFLVDEVAAINNFSRGEATRFLAVALTLGHRLADTWAALADGELTWSRARAIAEEVNRCGPDVDPHVVATVEAVVLPEAAELSVGALRARVRTEFIRRDAEAADKRRKEALKTADVFLRRTGDEGMSEVVTRLPHEAAAAMLDAIDSAARTAKAAGDQRPIGLIRAEVQANLTLRPWDTSRPAVTARLTILATLNALLPDPAVPGGGGTPTGVGLVDGEPVTAAHLRALLAALDAIGPGGLRAPPEGSLQLDLIGGGGNLLATLTRPELEAAARRGCPEHGGAAADCRCPLTGPPPATDAYEATAAQRRFLTSRDRGCRHPGCRARAGWADLDHVLPHGEGGATDCDNLCCLCRRHHRLKTFAPGWAFALDDDGNYLVTTPTGVTRISRPPGSYLLEPYEFGLDLPDALIIDVPPF